jgi:hypothetical protein
VSSFSTILIRYSVAIEHLPFNGGRQDGGGARTYAPPPGRAGTGAGQAASIGYARTSTARQELASQLEALHRAECHKVFKEQISTRVKVACQ